MLDSKQRIVVTGCCGFIGKNFAKQLLADGHEIINIDKLTYCSDKKIHAWFYEQPNYSFIHGDIATLETLPECDIVVNFAAESHVDNSIRSSRHFTVSNVLGVQNLLELIRAFDRPLRPRFVQISTDEVYGDNIDGKFDEGGALHPSNPYSASKAGAEHILLSFARTYGIQFQTVRMSNVYGYRQYPEKLIPRSLLRLLSGRKAQIQGNGSAMRTWLHVDDAVQAILTVLHKGELNNIYNVSGDEELTVLEVVRHIVDALGLPFKDAIEHVADRPGQDIRYGIDDTKLRKLGWRPRVLFEPSIKEIAIKTKADPHW